MNDPSEPQKREIDGDDHHEEFLIKREESIKQEDFTIQCNKGGYMIYYKDKPIGGAGTLTRGKNLRGRAASIQTHDYRNMGNYDIQRILRGQGDQRYYEAINKINSL